MLREERKASIVNLFRHNNIIQISELSKMLSVSKNTIRRDLEALERQGLIERIHGGAISRSERGGAIDLSWQERESKFQKEKRRIGYKAAQMIEDGESIILDAGTTIMQVARCINKRNLTVVTNAVNIGMELSGKKGITVVLTGGILREISVSLVGPLAEDFLNNNIHVDKMFLSAGGVDGENGVTNANTIEVPIKRVMIRAAKEVILVVTHDKIGKKSFTRVVPLKEVNKIITDEYAPKEQVEFIQKQGVEVILV